MLYLELMEQMNKPMMDKHLASTTFKYIKILLRSDRIKTQVCITCTILPSVTCWYYMPASELQSHFLLIAASIAARPGYLLQ